MNSNFNADKKQPQEHHYPPLFEHLVPIVLGVILVSMLIVVIIAVGVALFSI